MTTKHHTEISQIMTQLPDVLYCIEHVARELNPASAVAHFARERYGLNIHVHVLSRDLDPIFDTHRPALVTIPYCTSRRFIPRTIVKKMESVPILNMACEQLLSNANKHYRLPKDKLARERITHAAAGDFFREWLMQSNVPAQNIEVVGSLPYQLYRAPYRNFFASRRQSLAEQHGLDANRPWVLLPENFGAAFFSTSQIRKRIKGGFRLSDLHAYVTYSRKAFNEISKWCGAAVARGDVELIIRPRPAMSKKVFCREFYKASERGPHPRLHFIKEGDIRDWIFASEMVVSSFSTTLLEAALAGKPAYMLSPLHTPQSSASDWHGLAQKVTSLDEFTKLIADPTVAPPATALHDWVNENLLSRGDAIQNTARLIADICDGTRETPIPGPPDRRHVVIDAVRDRLSAPERYVRNKIRPQSRRIFGHESDNIERRDIDVCHARWSEHLGCSASIVAA